MKTVRFNSSNLNTGFLFVLVGLAFWVNLFVLNEGIVHDFPSIQTSSDANQHTCYAEGLEESRDWRVRPDFMAAGIKDSLHYSPPILYFLSLFISQFAGIPIYDAIGIVASFAYILPVFPIYLLVRKYFSENVALVSAGLILFPIVPSWIYSLTIGFWIFILGSFFIPFILYALFLLIETRETKYAVLLGVFLTGQFFAHPPVAIMLIPFILFFCFYHIFKNRDIVLLKQCILSAGIVFALSFWYLLDFYFGYVKGPSYGVFGINLGVPDYAFGFKEIGLSMIPSIQKLFIVLGVVFLLFNRKELKSPLSLWILFFTLFTVSNEIGVVYWPMRFRLLWMFYFSIIIAYGFCKTLEKLRLIKLLPIFLILIIGFSAYSQIEYNKQYSPLFTQNEQDAVDWIRENTSENASFLALFGFVQTSMCYSQRTMFEVNFDYMVNKAKAGEVPTEFYGSYLFQINDLPKKNGFLNYSYYKNSTYPKDFESACNFDYVIGNYAVLGHPLEEYNVYLMNNLLNTTRFQIVYNKDGVGIIKNVGVKGKC